MAVIRLHDVAHAIWVEETRQRFVEALNAAADGRAYAWSPTWPDDLQKLCEAAAEHHGFDAPSDPALWPDVLRNSSFGAAEAAIRVQVSVGFLARAGIPREQAIDLAWDTAAAYSSNPDLTRTEVLAILDAMDASWSDV